MKTNESHPTNYKPSIGFVDGFLLNIDRHSRKAKTNSLNHRVSITFDTYNPEHTDGMYFDVDMFALLFHEIVNLFTFDTIGIYHEDEESIYYKTFEEAMKDIRSFSLPENDPPLNISLYYITNMVCYIETEFYVACGGPRPYHDSYNFAIYSQESKSAAILEITEAICIRNNITIRSMEKEQAIPKTTGKERLRRFFLG